MIIELDPKRYDAEGKKTFRPASRKRSGFRPTFPMGRYVSQPLSLQCATLEEMAAFLLTCKYVSDEEQFDQEDYWAPPEHFESTREGDCDDHALWAWRQLMGMGYRARFVVGESGRYGVGHAWVTFEVEGRHYLCEALVAGVGTSLPRLSGIRYKPSTSVEWNGKKLSYFKHENQTHPFTLSEVFKLGAEWLRFWTAFWVRILWRLPMAFVLLLRRKISRR